jgi:L-fuculokinase
MITGYYLIFDIGKTNKKYFLFDDEGAVIANESVNLLETVDEDNVACEDLNALTNWILQTWQTLQTNYTIKAINFTTYGASFVHLDKNGAPLLPLYNYLKQYPTKIWEQFLQTYFYEEAIPFALETASPPMGMLNSGLQLYWLKYSKPEVWNDIHYSLHLPQYLSYLFSQQYKSDYTSIGCHTGLWDFKNNNYHNWVQQESIYEKLAPISNECILLDNNLFIGSGLHDSSAALIPYLKNYKEPFLLISTGTWCICLNPFTNTPITVEELNKDTLCFLQANGQPVKASRAFLGKEHDYQCERIATHFKVAPDFFKTIDASNINKVAHNIFIPACLEGSGPTPEKQEKLWDLNAYRNATEAYTALIYGLVEILSISINMVLTPNIKDLFVDGGFAANTVFIQYIQDAFPNHNITKVAFPQATALGAFLEIQQQVNNYTPRLIN